MEFPKVQAKVNAYNGTTVIFPRQIAVEVCHDTKSDQGCCKQNPFYGYRTYLP